MTAAQSPKISLVLYTSKVLIDGTSPLRLRVYYNGRRRMYSLLNYPMDGTLLSARANKWNKKTQDFTGKDDPRNEILTDIKAKIQRYFLELRYNEKPFTVAGLENYLFTRQNDSSFYAVMDARIDQLDAQDKHSYKQIFSNTLAMVKKFTKKRPLTLTDINNAWLIRFDNWLKLTCSTNTRSIYMRNIRTLYNKAIEEGHISEEHYPFGKRGFKIASATTTKRALTRQEIESILTAKVPQEYQDAQNYFAMSYYCAGANFADIARWRWDRNYKMDRIEYVRHKTKGKQNERTISVPVTRKVAEIISQYSRSTNYIFPIIFSKNSKTIYYQIKGKLKYTNASLKKIAALAGVEDPDRVTFYVARHTFATVLKREGENIHLISELLGHEDITTTQIYLDSLPQDYKDKVLRGL